MSTCHARTFELALLVAAIVFLACGAPPDAERSPNTHRKGGAASTEPRRIVSIVPAATEILFAIGAGPRVVGVGSFDRHPAEIARLPRVGGLLDPDLERIIELRPDLVILYGTQEDLRSQLTRLGIPMFTYSHGGLEDAIRSIRELGQRTGTSSPASRVAGDIERRLTALRALAAGGRRPRTLLVIEREPGSLRNIYASGGYGFLDDMLQAAGGTNVFGAIKREALQATAEAILAAAPEVILELKPDAARGLDVMRERAAWQKLSSVPAVSQGKVYELIGDEFVVPGPRVADAVERMAAVLRR